jgi:hypothetical protein
MEGVNKDNYDVIVNCENSAGMMSSWKGFIGKWMRSSSNV